MDDEDEENISDEKPITKHNKHSSAFNDLPDGELPLTSIITQLKQNELVYLLELQIDWAEVIGIKIKEQGLWIYALMAALEKPPHPDVTRYIYLSKIANVENITPFPLLHFHGNIQDVCY